ncbi:MAG: 4-alpha-glucanotransferase, partial [Lentisphaerae bacterium]|nr:4-alpha-glucanotransferase [Lentisphaerota bacterium]
MHITSLPGPYGMGDLGPQAVRFADFLRDAGQSCWQVLPLNPPTSATGASPYDVESAFAGNPWLISPERLMEDGLLTAAQCRAARCPPSDDRVRYGTATRRKQVVLRQAWAAFRRTGPQVALEAFCARHRGWLDDYALFRALKLDLKAEKWWTWPTALRNRQAGALRTARKKLAEPIAFEMFVQFLFDRQWQALKTTCNERGILLFGDMPIYVSQGSADVWAHPECFKLSARRVPRFVAGVPPDYFSSSGQLWGNPVFDWEALRQQDYAWWLARMDRNFQMFDFLRIDHFRGLVAYWEVPAGHKTARNGKWVDVPVDSFFDAVFRRHPFAPLIAEDLGTITPDVINCMHRYQLPGMRVLQFAFGSEPDDSPYYPHAFPRHSVAYTGTHDNNTARGWFEGEASARELARLSDYAGRRVRAADAAREMVRQVMASPADLAVFPLQDILGLGAEARMNRPGTATGNWRWRVRSAQLSA